MSRGFSLHSTPEPHEETGVSPGSGCVPVRHGRRRVAHGTGPVATIHLIPSSLPALGDP